MATGIETGLGVAETALVTAETLLGGATFKSRVAVMDLESIFFVEFDALVSVTYTGNAQVTDHPVESSLDITDHIRRMPKELRLRGIVSDSPILTLASFRATPAVPGTDPTARAKSAFQFLEDVVRDGGLVHVSTSLFDIENMAITSLSCTRDKDTANIADIQLTLREVVIATTLAVEVNAPKITRADIGKQVKTAATAPVAAASGSILVNLLALIF